MAGLECVSWATLSADGGQLDWAGRPAVTTLCEAPNSETIIYNRKMKTTGTCVRVSPICRSQLIAVTGHQRDIGGRD